MRSISICLIRIIHDYRIFGRREAPQFFAEIKQIRREAERLP